MEFDVQDTDPDKLNESKFDRPAPGKYHFLISGIDPNDGTDKAMTVDFEVVAGTVEGQEGKTIRKYYGKKSDKGADATKACQNNMLSFAVAAGLITLDDIRKKKEAGQRIRINFDAAENRSVMMEVRMGKDKDGNPQPVCAFECFHVNDPKVAEWPKNGAFMGGSDAVPATEESADEFAGAF